MTRRFEFSMNHNINISNPIIYRKSTFHVAGMWQDIKISFKFGNLKRLCCCDRCIWRIVRLRWEILLPPFHILCMGFREIQLSKNGVQTFSLIACCNCICMILSNLKFKWCKQKHVWQLDQSTGNSEHSGKIDVSFARNVIFSSPVVPSLLA